MTNEMKLKINGILKTLPIGYYIKKNVPVTLEDCPCSYYDFVSQTITISTRQLEQSIAKLDDESKIENDVRCMLYHEVSHAFASYRFPNWDCFAWSSIMNIFEDERIETLFAKKYMGVNFKEYVKRLCDYDKEAVKKMPDNAESFFFDIVRFRTGPKKFVAEVQEIIDKYAEVSLLCEDRLANRYRDDVHVFWNEVKEYFYNNKNALQDEYNKADEQNNESTNDEETNSSGSDKKAEAPKSEEPAQQEETSKADQKEEPENSDKEEQSEEDEEEQSEESEETTDEETADEESEESEEDSDPYTIVVAAFPFDGNLDDADPDPYAQLTDTFFEGSLNKYADSKIQQQFEAIINNSRRASARNGAAINSYSGVFDPRSVARDDYKYFLVKNRIGNAKQYSKLHLNLFIDNSGSYRPNDNITNCMLACLSNIEKTNPDFSFQLVTMNITVVEHKNNDITLKSDNCNRLPKELFDIVKKYQYRDRHVINIVMFDGNFVTGEAHREEAKKNCAAFNVPNTTIITDPDNELAFRRYCKGPKLIVTRNYADELIKHVLTALQAGL